MGPDVVVVLHYRGVNDTLRCLDSLIKGSPQASILVVDNGSHDDVAMRIHAKWGNRVRLSALPANLGFTGGMNHGIMTALDLEARTITILNNDTVVPPGSISRLAEVATAEARLVSPEIRYLEDPERVWFGAGGLDEDVGIARHFSDAEIAQRFPPKGLRRVEVLSGCCLTASAAVWRSLGGFDPFYFLMFEDSELSIRAARLGVDLVVDPDALVLHAVSASFTGPWHELGHYYYSRNGLRFLSKVLKSSLLTRYRFIRRQVLPSVAAGRHDGCSVLVRRTIVTAFGLIHALADHGGIAPPCIRRIAGVLDQ